MILFTGCYSAFLSFCSMYRYHSSVAWEVGKLKLPNLTGAGMVLEVTSNQMTTNHKGTNSMKLGKNSYESFPTCPKKPFHSILLQFNHLIFIPFICVVKFPLPLIYKKRKPPTRCRKRCSGWIHPMAPLQLLGMGCLFFPTESPTLLFKNPVTWHDFPLIWDVFFCWDFMAYIRIYAYSIYKWAKYIISSHWTLRTCDKFVWQPAGWKHRVRS